VQACSRTANITGGGGGPEEHGEIRVLEEGEVHREEGLLDEGGGAFVEMLEGVAHGLAVAQVGEEGVEATSEGGGGHGGDGGGLSRREGLHHGDGLLRAGGSGRQGRGGGVRFNSGGELPEGEGGDEGGGGVGQAAEDVCAALRGGHLHGHLRGEEG
jgi:hypothetical protein